MPNPTDIVTVLRQEMFYQPTSRLNEFGKPQMGFELTRTNLLAADEIERLRKELETLHQHIKDIKEGFEGCCNACEPVGEMNKKLREERDEARREVCSMKSFNFDQCISPEAYADLRKWDCYKENTND